ncbi:MULTISPECIES: hypothetical protein [Streptomycetaceae]|uniref:Uncharacterized protein n=1 Tax=Streptantibioticus cattleyicolor (strain ATCC 35852 / DSM 46488 / JCM 4925 / NBRC 14057 / NRRL 8057) TaxID=1003195 RepID=F8JS30_STREN|nr:MULTISPECIES: hypothetical protein [Streptomycetaceae]AEW92941.1 hypothetical protein SCATT_05700 [Streptantibioticus cattleyicolor NRRL 8057 = DSM 46488]MYS57688.1 hypothetical protein [Streptomyces sp. SID5468]CCB73301.1 protein of unknown function [Streptantibioticus cattleyicolor NRRL 8057 = DSM 46488]
MSVSYVWAPITKAERRDDGTLIVYGPAATSALDRDQQRLDSAWLDTAMPRWMAEGGAVREQHDAKRAVGVGVGLSKGDDGAHHIAAHIVDPVAVKKVEAKVLRGFSVGIKNPVVEMGKTDAPNGLITGGEVIEVSVVDRPANPECLFELAKADEAGGGLAPVEDAQVITRSDTYGIPAELYNRLAAPVKDALATLAGTGARIGAEVVKTDESATPLIVNVSVHPEAAKADLSAAGRRQAAASGAAMSDGSYPIRSKAELRKAIRAVGRGGSDHDAIRKHIITRAKALGLEGMVPENWNPDGSLKADPDTTKADTSPHEQLAETAETILRDVRSLVPELAKADDGDESEGGEEESGDISGAEQAIALIAKLIVSEAESLAMGNLNEAYDIATLLDAVRALRWFKCSEESEQTGETMNLTDQPHTPKADEPTTTPVEPSATEPPDETTEGAPDPEPAADRTLMTRADIEAGIREAVNAALAELLPDTPPAPASEPEPVTKADITDMVKTALAEAKAARQSAQALEADLAKATGDLEAIKQLPMPGGPVLTRTAGQQAAAVASDAAALRTQAEELLRKADSMPPNSVLANGYRARARDLLNKAAA